MYTTAEILQMQFDDYARGMTKTEREFLIACCGDYR